MHDTIDKSPSKRCVHKYGAKAGHLKPMPTDRLEQSGLNRAWIAAAAALPLEWRIEAR
jgi:hypothetical protein